MSTTICYLAGRSVTSERYGEHFEKLRVAMRGWGHGVIVTSSLRSVLATLLLATIAVRSMIHFVFCIDTDFDLQFQEIVFVAISLS